MKTVDNSWSKFFEKESAYEYFKEMSCCLEKEKKKWYPSKENIFKAFELTPMHDVKVILLGQDPYHGESQANGLSFSVNQGVKVPPSLKNIFIELESDTGIKQSNHGDLSAWAKCGILLLNSVLTVCEKEPNSHKSIGWERFTDAVIREFCNKNVVFILLGKQAQKKCSVVNRNIVKANHPSPLSAYSGFFGSKIFSKTNEALSKLKLPPMNWRLE